MALPPDPNRRTVMAPPSGGDWTVYRIATSSSSYHLAIYAGTAGQRRCAVLRGCSDSLGKAVEVQDSAPLIGGRSLFAVLPSDWVGHQLEVATVKTSPIASVDRETDQRTVMAVGISAGLMLRGAVKAAPARVRPPYPEDYVERAEDAAALLTRIHEKREIVTDLREHAHLMDRFEIALSQCLLMLKGLSDRTKR